MESIRARLSLAATLDGLVTSLSRFAPPVALMALIFYLSAQPDLGTGLGVWDTILRKLAHMTVYGALWFLWWRALGYGNPFPAVAIAIAYGISDEWHQSFVEGRHGSPIDVLIDTLGIAAAFALVKRVAGRRERRGREGDSAPARTPTERDVDRRPERV